MTVREAVQAGVDRLRENRIETPYLDATVLLAETLGMGKEKLFASFSDLLPESSFEAFQQALDKRISGFPVSYIRHKKEFFGRIFYVDDRVLVPRPDTEIIVESVLALTGGFDRPRILDLCTGSGCIAVTVACECGILGREISLTGSDISKGAGAVFRQNALTLYGRKIPFIRSDLFESIEGKFDIIVSNPPYLTEMEMEGFRTMGWPEPELALNGGNDGLDCIRRIIKKSVEYLERNGYLLLEASPDQMNAVASLLQKEDFADIHLIKDLGNRNRVIQARYGNG